MGEHRATALLAVEDADQPQALARLLGESGIDALTVGGDGALDRLAGGAIDVFVASAPARPAPAELVEEALRRDPGVEIVIAVARGAFENALACLRAGASDIVASPIEGVGLLSAVTRALERRRARCLARELLDSARAAGLGQLAGSIAHEISNPLAILTSSLEAASQSFTALSELRSIAPQQAGPFRSWWEWSGRQALEQANEVMSEAREGTQRLKLLARDLREMARSNPSLVDEVEVGEAIDAALRVSRAELITRLKVALDVPSHLTVRANRGSLAQALAHVFVRAAQAVQAAGIRRGNVHVRGRQREGMALIEVEDDIPARAESAARHLTPYLPSGIPAGSGALGLAVARDLVERQGGMLTARAREGGGTVFELRMRTAGRAQDTVTR